MRLDRFLTRSTDFTRHEVWQMLAAQRITVFGKIERDRHREISEFTEVALDGGILQNRRAVYLMLNKPAGYLSATSDPQHPTVIELLNDPLRHELHLAGRLDRASTGLLLLTNDGKWSRSVTEPEQEIDKIYRVTTRDPISDETSAIFQRGIYFAFEDLTTRPAELRIVNSHEAVLSIHEGRYHQVKRMFHAVGNKVLSLHRESIGPLVLDPNLAPGDSRPLTSEEIDYFSRA
jgi:16S rRNA pseudouridine516 synthase